MQVQAQTPTLELKLALALAQTRKSAAEFRYCRGSAASASAFLETYLVSRATSQFRGFAVGEGWIVFYENPVWLVWYLCYYSHHRRC